MARATLSPECRLVFLSANPVVNDAAIAEAVRGPVEWNRAVWIAEKEHAAAGLWRALERSARDIVPPNVADHLRKNAMVSDFKMLHLETRLQQTLAALKKRGVQGMLL
jgi:hypothetical protein